MTRNPSRTATGIVIALLLALNLVASSHAQGPVLPDNVEAVSSIGSAFTYQGRLKKAGAPADTTCSFRFSLWTAASGGGQRGDTLTVNNVAVRDGLFTVRLDFGYQYFGDDRWLQTAVKCAGDATFTLLNPRTRLTGVPYASSLAPGAYTVGSTGEGTAIIRGENRGTGVGVWGETIGSGNAGVYGFSSHGRGVWGFTTIGTAGVYGHNSSTASGDSGVLGEANEPGTFGVEGYSANGEAGVYGRTDNPNGSGIYGQAYGNNAAGVYGRNEYGAGVWGYTPVEASGVYGQSDGAGGRGVYGLATNSGGIGVRGEANVGQAFGVYGSSKSNNGVGGFSESAGGAGVIGESPFIGVQGATFGTTNNDQGVRGIAAAPDAWAGYFDGKVGTTRFFYAPSAATQLDHPLDPANRTLSHAFVESPDMKSVYDGVITTGADGTAVVELPAYVEALNSDFRYQLTVIGQFAQAIIDREIAGNQFTIRTDRPNVKVSWQVTGIRNDPWAAENRVQVEEWKPAAERGLYLHPELYDQSVSKAVPRNQPSALEAPAPVEPLGAGPAASPPEPGSAER